MVQTSSLILTPQVSCLGRPYVNFNMSCQQNAFKHIGRNSRGAAAISSNIQTGQQSSNYSYVVAWSLSARPNALLHRDDQETILFFFWPTGQWQRIRPLKATLFAAASNAVPSSAVRSNHFLPNIGILASKRPILEHDFPVQDIYFLWKKVLFSQIVLDAVLAFLKFLNTSGSSS